MANFSDDSDDTLITRIRGGDEAAISVLLERYRPLVRRRANALFLVGGDSDDLNQEGMIGLYLAVRNYDPGRGASFSTFADLCIRRQMYRAIEADGRDRNRLLNAAMPLEDVDETVPGGENPEITFLENEARAVFEEKYAGILSLYERKVLHYYLEGYRYTEIASILQKTPKSADNAIQRIRAKIMQAEGETSE